MSEAYECDKCGSFYAGAPVVEGLFRSPNGPCPQGLAPDESGDVDLCDGCWEDLCKTFGFKRLQRQEAGDE